VVMRDPSCGAGGCGLDKSIIRRYIKRSMEKIRYCYERQLLTNADLEGTVVASFVITPSGAVMNSTASGLDAAVGGCVASVVSAIAFPRLDDDAAVQVSYPFIFRRAS
jgi:hypothetical protein